MSEIQELGTVLDKYFKVARRNEETFPSFEVRENHAHGELSRVLTALEKQDAHEEAKLSFVEARGPHAEERAAQLEQHIQRTVSGVQKVETPQILRGWHVLRQSGLSINEKSSLRSLTGGSYQLKKVFQKLKELWPEDELIARDRSRSSSAKRSRTVLAAIETIQNQDQVYYEEDEYDEDYQEWPGEYWEETEEYPEDGDFDDLQEDDDEFEEPEGEQSAELADELGVEDHVNVTASTRDYRTAKLERNDCNKNRNPPRPCASGRVEFGKVLVLHCKNNTNFPSPTPPQGSGPAPYCSTGATPDAPKPLFL